MVISHSAKASHRPQLSTYPANLHTHWKEMNREPVVWGQGEQHGMEHNQYAEVCSNLIMVHPSKHTCVVVHCLCSDALLLVGKLCFWP